MDMTQFKALQNNAVLMVDMKNASLERVDIQCDSLPMAFIPGEVTKVPANLLPFVYEKVSDYGVFPVFSGATKEDIKKSHREALIRYLNGALKERIKNYTLEEDELKRKGVTNARSRAFTRALRWRDEIIALLEMESPIEEELSFLDAEKRKKLGYDSGLETHVDTLNIFDMKDAEVIPVSEIAKEKVAAKRGRQKTSFAEINIGEI